MCDLTSLPKCVVWDLDNCLWKGTLIEDVSVSIDELTYETVKTLDAVGVIQSIASRNEGLGALAKLDELGLRDIFIYPQISWGDKSEMIKIISSRLGIRGPDMIFIDDQDYERDEVYNNFPEIRCYGIEVVEKLNALSKQKSNSNISVEARRRASLYREENLRVDEEIKFSGRRQDFLKSLDLRCHVRKAVEDDLTRAEELVQRTNQLNATGKIYSAKQLREFINNPKYCLLICELLDKYGNYGRVGLALLEIGSKEWRIKLLLMSCRIINRDAGNILLNVILLEARSRNIRVTADFIRNSKNRLMELSFRLSGFVASNSDEKYLDLQYDENVNPVVPEHVRIEANIIWE